jgi:hypothetical protein
MRFLRWQRCAALDYKYAACGLFACSAMFVFAIAMITYLGNISAINRNQQQWKVRAGFNWLSLSNISYLYRLFKSLLVFNSSSKVAL